MLILKMTTMMMRRRKVAVQMMNRRRPLVQLTKHSGLKYKLLLVQLWLTWKTRFVERKTKVCLQVEWLAYQAGGVWLMPVSIA